MSSAVKKSILDNGIRIITHTLPYTRSVAMGVWVDAGARDESPSEKGLCHFIEHLLFKGTTTRSAYQIAKELDSIGGHSNAFTSMEYTCFHARVLDTHTSRMVDILSDILLNPLFGIEEIEKEKPVICQEIAMMEDNPEEHVHLLAGKALWGNHPLGHSVLGTAKNIMAFDRVAVRDFFNRLYTPEKIIITVAGNMDHLQMVDTLFRHFGAIEPGKSLSGRKKPEYDPGILKLEKHLEQSHICIATPGISANCKGRFAFSLANTILGGNMSSRLFQEVREKRGLAYSVYSFAASYSDTGIFGVYTAVDPKNSSLVIDIILGEMKKLKDQPVTRDELTEAKEYTKGSLLLASESVENRMVRLAQNEITFGRYIPIKEVINSIDAVTPTEIKELAESLFDDERTAIAILGPEKRDSSYLTAFNF